MIKKEDIKVGLEFVLPYREFNDEAEKKEFYNRLISGNKEYRSHRYYTDIRLAGEEDTLVTAHRPILRVIGITKVKNVTGAFDIVSAKNINDVDGDLFMRQIDSSFIEEYGEAVMSKKNFNGVLYSCIDDFFCDNYPLFKRSQIDNVFCQTTPERNWAQNVIIVGGSRSGNKSRLLHDWYHYKLKMPLYENNAEQSNEDCKAFKAITDKMSDTYKRKNHDYGNAFSEMYDELGINYGYGKIREKVNRIKTLKDNEAQVANEPLEDALLDCANYCILTLMEYQKRKEHGTD